LRKLIYVYNSGIFLIKKEGNHRVQIDSTQWVPGAPSLRVTQIEREVVHSLLYMAEVMNMWILFIYSLFNK
jgi:hypothetical protein